MATEMSSKLYKAATAGDVRYLSSNDVLDFEEINESSEERRKHHLSSLTHDGNSCLHIAARFGHEKFMQRVISVCPSLVFQQNRRGDNPLHVAARAGHLGVVQLLTDSFQQLWPPQSYSLLSSNRPPWDAEKSLTMIQDQEKLTKRKGISLYNQPTRTYDEGQSSVNSATAGDDITSARALGQAEEGKRPSSPIWSTQNQQKAIPLQPLRSSKRSTRSENGATAKAGVPSEESLSDVTEEGVITVLQNQENSTALTDTVVKPPSTSQSQSTGNSATTGDDMSKRSLIEEADEEERPSPLIRRSTRRQQNSREAVTDSIHDKPQISESSENGSTAVKGMPSEGSPTTHVADQEGEISAIQDQENSEPPPTFQSQISTRNSATVRDEIIPERSLLVREADDQAEWRPSLESPPLWRTQNHDGCTALHEALRNKHGAVALHLLDLDLRVADEWDDESAILLVSARNESPTYLAAEAGFIHVLTKIVHLGGGHSTAGPNDQTPLHAAVFAGNVDCIKVLLEWNPSLTENQDSTGKTALHYATQSNSLKIMDLLLHCNSSSAYIRDSDGLSPILVAASMCSQPTVKVILHACPAAIESTDNRGRNALHLAVKHNTLPVLRGLLSMPEMMYLINQPDEEGNTPLHLATMGHKYGYVKALLSTKCVDLTSKNNSGQTALDLCTLDWELTARQTRIWKELRGKKASRGRVRPLMRLPWRPTIFTSKSMADAANLKEAVNTLSVVASLLATVTFAAVLQLPGGYQAAGTNVAGSPVLIHKPALKVFFISDTISLCCSMMALPPLLVATRSDTAFLRATVRYSQNLVILALYTAMIAFISGLYLVLSIESLWSAILVCVLGSSFPFLSEYIASMAHTYTPFVPGLLQKQKTRFIAPQSSSEPK